jgi:hypothetical protein
MATIEAGVIALLMTMALASLGLATRFAIRRG